jgi:dynein heavy chain
LPKDADPPEAFGQHPNADIASQMTETKTLLGTLLSLQPKSVSAGERSREEVVTELIAQLQEQLPKALDLTAIGKRHADDHTPLKTVLLQE